MTKALCFTGPRPNKLAGYSGPRAEALYSAIKNKLIGVVLRASNTGFNKFISGGALGIDQIAAHAVIHVRNELAHNIRLVIATPFPSQPSRWPLHSQEEYYQILEAADAVVHCSHDPYSPAKMQKRNAWMVDQSRAVVAIYNNTGGGTLNCINYAKKMKRPVLVINPFTLEERWEH